METKFKFNSQVCASKIQSERLLALGLKKETADCCHRNNSLDGKPYTTALFVGKHSSDIPAWSLHRLWELGKFLGIHLSSEVAISNLYEYAIARIEMQIKGGYFNKEYLV